MYLPFLRTVVLLMAATAALAGCSRADDGDDRAPTPTSTMGAATLPGDADRAFVTSGTLNEPDGEKIYRRVCAACHMGDGRGAVGAGHYPALIRNDKLAAADYPIYVILNGLNGMPPVGKMMSDQQVADVVNYVRSNFGNSYTDRTSAAAVKAARDQPQ